MNIRRVCATAGEYHEFIKLIQDIGGGILATAPDKKDWENPDIHPWDKRFEK
jgi:aromatic ring hydroxylase